MFRSDCTPDLLTYNVFIYGMCKEGKLQKTARVVDEMLDNGFPPDVLTYSTVIHALCKGANMDELSLPGS
ncbi:hypothetical protein SUGI_1054900 [Cryptomeria japonica]|nr:hypothetical protein SUGI_1054900 [Cryptomeria japonica]